MYFLFNNSNYSKRALKKSFKKIHIIYFILSVNDLISVSVALDENLCPDSQLPVLVKSSNNLALFPKLDEALVQNGIIVLPVKSLSFTKLFTGHAATPHYAMIFGNLLKNLNIYYYSFLNINY